MQNSLHNTDSGGAQRPRNEVELFTDGDSYFRAAWRDIERAQSHVWLDFYIVEDDRVGRRTRELLVDAARRGCEVRLLYDRLGSYDLPGDFFDELMAAGGHVVTFNTPLALFREKRRLWSPLHRNHRKALIVDLQMAYTGGANIGEEYAGDELGNNQYHDLVIRVDGPATLQMAHVFASSWRSATGEELSIPSREHRGHPDVRVLAFDAQEKEPPLEEVVCGLLDRARDRCFISTPYFIPPRWLRKAMSEADRRGVDVRLMTSGDSDVPPARYAGRHFYRRLLRAGVRVYEYFGQTLHDKYIVVDGQVALVGSHNFDLWSEHHNLESGVLIEDAGFAAELERDFCINIDGCREIVLDDWLHRALPARILEWTAFQVARL